MESLGFTALSIKLIEEEANEKGLTKSTEERMIKVVSECTCMCRYVSMYAVCCYVHSCNVHF